MKRINISTLLAIMMAVVIGTQAVQAQTISKEVKVTDFDALCLEAVGKIYFTQGENYSVILKGKQEWVLFNEVFVEGNTLYIKIKDKEKKAQRKGIDIYITAPTLKEIDIRGAGEFHSKSTLTCKELKCELQGIGKIFIHDLICKKLEAYIKGIGGGKIHMDCQELKASINGIGSLTLSGQAKVATISKDGIGRVDDDDLQVGR